MSPRNPHNEIGLASRRPLDTALRITAEWDRTTVANSSAARSMTLRRLKKYMSQ